MSKKKRYLIFIFCHWCYFFFFWPFNFFFFLNLKKTFTVYKNIFFNQYDAILFVLYTSCLDPVATPEWLCWTVFNERLRTEKVPAMDAIALESNTLARLWLASLFDPARVFDRFRLCFIMHDCCFWFSCSGEYLVGVWEGFQKWTRKKLQEHILKMFKNVVCYLFKSLWLKINPPFKGG